MAADQRRKRLHTSVSGSSSKQQPRVKRKILGLRHYDSCMKSHISLEWDGNEKRVVAKRNQIGISQRNLRPFNSSVPHQQNTLADIFAVPEEIFELENLTGVLSNEVWQSHLSESERKYLMEFLPSGSEPQQVLQALFSGDNFHFGNPFLKWGASLCSGSLHPDAVLHREQCLKAGKKVYYSKLQKYHNEMIGYLLKLKERWENCKDPEKEIGQKPWRSRNGLEKRIPSLANESEFAHPEEDLTATSESCSGADDRVCSSDNQNSPVMKGAELLKRMSEKGYVKDKRRNLLIASDEVLNIGARSRSGDKLQKHAILCTDGAKYMSYFKISKKQHELVKNMKQSGKSIQSRSLNRVLGDLGSFHVQPYEVFLQEEQKKLHHHWSQLAIKVLPKAYANWKERKSQRLLITSSLEKELKDKLKFSMKDEDDKNLESMLPDQEVNKLINSITTVEENEESISGSSHNRESIPGSPQNQDSVPGSLQSQESVPSSLQNHESVPDTSYNQESILSSPENQEFITTGSSQNQESIATGSPQSQTSQHISSLSGGHEIPPVDMDSENDHNMSRTDNVTADDSKFLGNLSTADVEVSQGVPLTSGDDVWPAVSVPHSYYDSAASHEFTSASGLPLERSQVIEQQRVHLIDLESDLHAAEARKGFLHRQAGECSFSAYPNQDRNELLQSLFKSQGMLSYHQEHKQTGLEFQPPDNLSMENGQFPGHYQEQEQQPQSIPLEPEQKRQNDVYMHQNISGNMYSDGVRYLIPRQEHLAPVSVQDLAVTIRMPAPLQSGLNGGELLSQDWFASEHQVQSGWTATDAGSVQSQNIGSGNAADQSLFHVLSHCNQLRASGPFDSLGSNDQFIAPRNYGMVDGNAAPRMSNVMSQAPHSLDYLGGHEAATSMMPDDMGWVSLPQQNSVIHDPMGKPFLRSWNH